MIKWKEDLSPLHKEKRAFRSTKRDNENGKKQDLDQTLHGLLRMLYLRDYETEAHTARVTKLTLELAKKVGVSEEECENIQIGSLLHDIGKIAIPDDILFKKGKLKKAGYIGEYPYGMSCFKTESFLILIFQEMYPLKPLTSFTGLKMMLKSILSGTLLKSIFQGERNSVQPVKMLNYGILNRGIFHP